jgi:glutamine synthetase type III
MKKIDRQFRQGDVLLVPVKALPADAQAVKHEPRIVLAEGEATGHAHAIRAKKSQVKRHATATGQLYLEVIQPVTLEHDEHGAATLPAGLYEVRRQVETWMDEVRQVAD